MTARAERDAYRVLTAAAVLVVAAIAAVVSYVHIEHLAVVNGQTPLAALLLPLSIDGAVAAASMVMLRAARAGLPPPGLARFMLGLSVAATLAANLAYGLPHGAPGALISGWPAVAFIGSVEMVIGMVRRARAVPGPQPVPVVTQIAPADSEHAARLALAASVTASNPLSQRQLIERFGLSRAQAAKVRQSVLAEANGHAPAEITTT